MKERCPLLEAKNYRGNCNIPAIKKICGKYGIPCFYKEACIIETITPLKNLLELDKNSFAFILPGDKKPQAEKIIKSAPCLHAQNCAAYGPGCSIKNMGNCQLLPKRNTAAASGL